MPTSTDLVTDLPADFETFGQAVATSMADLLGGTTGQILSKTTNADMDFTWIANDQGDITGVTAGTGISGGGTSGTVTVTNSMATAIDAKGDLIAGTAADTFARLAVGTNGQVLAADSTAATGLAWITNDVGDITEVTAGTGISGGGTSGAVTITNSMATAIDAKGDLVAGTAADTFSRLAVGTNNQILMADSTAGTGLKWAGDWTTFTPTLGGITIGNGSREGRYMQIGKTIIFSMRLVFGSTTTITGTPSMDLPVTAKITQFFTTGEIEDAGTTRYGIMGQVVASSATVYLYVGNVTGTYLAGSLISSSIPMTWTTNDVYTIAGTYEVA